jgi:nucleoside phosphorylase
MGIAGGNKDKTKLADVVATTEVLDNDGGVDYARTFSFFGLQFSFGRHQPRIEKIHHDRSLRNLLNGFSPDLKTWNKDIQRIVVEGDRGALKFDRSDRDVHSELKLGLVQAGERLKRDGSLPRTSRMFHDKLYAVEMEGSGFAQACNSYIDDWIVFRGISDFGDTKKRDNRQACASVAAAVLMKQFMEKTLQPTIADDDITF